MAKKNESEIIIVPQTKGGAGKSTISKHIVPILYSGKTINLFEIDDNNKSQLEKSKINLKSITVKDSEQALDDVHFDLLTGSNDVNIIDCGGGNDTIAILNHIAKSDLEGLTYLVPTNDDIEQIGNVKQTIELIKKADKKGKINLVFNRCKALDKEIIKEQFVAYFGNEDYGIEGQFDSIEDDIKECLFIEDNKIFGILKNYYNWTLLDGYNEALEIINNKTAYFSDWTKQGKEVFKEKKKMFRLMQDIKELAEAIKSKNTI